MNYVNNVMALLYVVKSKSYNYYQNYHIDNSVTRMNQDKYLPEKIYYFFSKPSLIIQKNDITLYLGSAYNSAHYDILKNLNITKIINATEEIPNYFIDDFEYLQLMILDNNSSSIQNYFEDIGNFVESGDTIFIHCYQGASRSASVILYLLITKFNYNFDEAVEYLQEIHPITNININYIDEIKALQNELIIKNESL